MTVGGGATLSLAHTDAIFLPLVARQDLAAREFDVQSARNDALSLVAQTYFDVQEARGQLASALDVQTKAEELVVRVTSLAKGLVPAIEIDRAQALLADVKQQVAAARFAWRTASARLTRVLRLNPGSVVIPLEPAHLEVTLISPSSMVDELIPIGLLNRPELASRRALVQATLERLRQEKLRPLIPSVILEGHNGPGNSFEGSVFGGGTDDRLNTWGGRFDMDLGMVWTLNNLGMGNAALVRERAAQQQAAILELFNEQDQVAQEVAEAQAHLEARAAQIPDAEAAVKEAIITFNGNLRGIAETRSAGGLLLLINRPQEAVAALQQLGRAYNIYYATVTGYNRAQFQLYHALGFPARIVAAERPTGQLQPVDTRRPAQMGVAP
jgi:outer membrane protein TolC